MGGLCRVLWEYFFLSSFIFLYAGGLCRVPGRFAFFCLLFLLVSHYFCLLSCCFSLFPFSLYVGGFFSVFLDVLVRLDFFYFSLSLVIWLSCLSLSSFIFLYLALSLCMWAVFAGFLGIFSLFYFSLFLFFLALFFSYCVGI